MSKRSRKIRRKARRAGPKAFQAYTLYEENVALLGEIKDRLREKGENEQR